MVVQIGTAMLSKFIETVNSLDEKASSDKGRRLQSEARNNPELWMPGELMLRYYQTKRLPTFQARDKRTSTRDEGPDQPASEKVVALRLEGAKD